MRYPTFLAACLAFGPVFATSNADAQSAVAPAPAADAPKQLADTLTGAAKTDYDIGKVLFRDGDFEGARTRFQAALDKSKEPRLLFNIAACERNRNNYGRTIRLVKQYRKEADALLTEADKKEADDVIAGLKSLVAPLELDVNEAGARIFVDDELVGTSPLADPVLVEFRKHKVRVTKDGFADKNLDVEVKGASGTSTTITLEKPEGRLVVIARSEDTIDVDGKLVSMGRLEAVLPYGAHQLKVTAPGYIAYQSEVTIQDKQPRTLNVSLQKEKGGGLPLWAWIGGGAVLAGGLAVGGYFIFRAASGDQGISTVPGTLGGVKLTSF